MPVPTPAGTSSGAGRVRHATRGPRARACVPPRSAGRSRRRWPRRARGAASDTSSHLLRVAEPEERRAEEVPAPPADAGLHRVFRGLDRLQAPERARLAVRDRGEVLDRHAERRCDAGHGERRVAGIPPTGATRAEDAIADLAEHATKR